MSVKRIRKFFDFQPRRDAVSDARVWGLQKALDLGVVRNPYAVTDKHVWILAVVEGISRIYAYPIGKKSILVPYTWVPSACGRHLTCEHRRRGMTRIMRPLCVCRLTRPQLSALYANRLGLPGAYVERVERYRHIFLYRWVMWHWIRRVRCERMRIYFQYWRAVANGYVWIDDHMDTSSESVS